MNPVTNRPTVNYTPGRSAPISRIVLHGGATGSLQELDVLACRECRGPNSRHCSFHYAVQNCAVRQYVSDADTAWSHGQPSVDGETLNIYVAGTYPTALAAGVVCDNCGFKLYSDKELRCLAELVASLAKKYNLNPASACSGLVHDDELPCFPKDEFIDMVREAMTSTPYTAVITDPPCFSNHAQVDGCLSTGGIAVWDGKCLKELTYEGTKDVADYTLALNAPATVRGIQIGGVFYTAPGAGIPVTFPTAPELTAWLNSLGKGAFAVNFVSGSAAAWAVSIVSPANENVVELLSVEIAGVPSLEAFVASNASTVPATVPVTGADILALLGVVCAAPAALATCYGLIQFADDLGGCPIAFASTQFDMSSIGGAVDETFADTAELLARVNTLTGGTWTFNAAMCRFESSAAACTDFVIGAECIPAPVAPTPVGPACGVSTQEVCYNTAGVCRQANLVIIYAGPTCVEVSRHVYDATTGAEVLPIPAFVDCMTCGCVNCGN